MDPIVEGLRRAGRDLYLLGLVSTRGGNLSARAGDLLVITRTGAPLGGLEPQDFVQVPVQTESEADAEASFDLVVHREIYRRSDALTVVHAHGPLTATLSFDGPLRPVDHEGRILMPEVPVFAETRPRSVLAGQVAEAVAGGCRAVAVRGHGTFCAGDTIDAAMQWTTALELSARVLLETRRAGIVP